ncbi:MAG: lipopolysaccharide transport system permease protein [Chloroflexota bacterium]|nr:lipopolysaccharide transport system permease protein [Chloroflexota bacterium]
MPDPSDTRVIDSPAPTPHPLDALDPRELTRQRRREAEREGEQHARVVDIEGGPGSITIGGFRELYDFREVLWAFVVRHVKVKYKQAAIGVGWAIIQPGASALLFTVFLGRLAKVPSEGAPYLLFALGGMVLWTFFASATTTAMESLISDQQLVRKVFFPREILPLAAVAAALVDFLPGLGVLMVAALFSGLGPNLTWLALPIPVLLVLVTAAGLGVGLCSLNVYYRDVRYTLPFILQIGLFASPVVYPLSLVPSGWRTIYAVANPVAAAIDGMRRIVIHHTWPNFAVSLAALAWATVLLVAGYALFKRLERGFADRV